MYGEMNWLRSVLPECFSSLTNVIERIRGFQDNRKVQALISD